MSKKVKKMSIILKRSKCDYLLLQHSFLQSMTGLFLQSMTGITPKIAPLSKICRHAQNKFFIVRRRFSNINVFSYLTQFFFPQLDPSSRSIFTVFTLSLFMFYISKSFPFYGKFFSPQIWKKFFSPQKLEKSLASKNGTPSVGPLSGPDTCLFFYIFS